MCCIHIVKKGPEFSDVYIYAYNNPLYHIHIQQSKSWTFLIFETNSKTSQILYISWNSVLKIIQKKC